MRILSTQRGGSKGILSHLHRVWVSAVLLVLVGAAPAAPAQELDAITPEHVARYSVAAGTAFDHEMLAAYYQAQAALKAAEVQQHTALLASYENAPGTRSADMRNHCRTLISVFRQAQKAFDGFAQEQQQPAPETVNP